MNFEKLLDGAKAEIRRKAAEVEKTREARDDAYYDGMEMYPEELIRKFKRSSGVKRAGYGKAMVERGILERDDDGKLVPSREYREYWR